MPKPTTPYTLSVQASTEHLAEVRDFVSLHASEFGFSDKEIHDIRLAVDEAFTNIIKHAYKNDSQKTVDIELGYTEQELWVALLDTGNAFDMRKYSQPDIRQRIKNKKRGGVGVYLIKELMDGVRYRTEGSVNEIRMTKKSKS